MTTSQTDQLHENAKENTGYMVTLGELIHNEIGYQINIMKSNTDEVDLGLFRQDDPETMLLRFDPDMTAHTKDGKFGDFTVEEHNVVLYEGPIRTRHVLSASSQGEVFTQIAKIYLTNSAR